MHASSKLCRVRKFGDKEGGCRVHEGDDQLDVEALELLRGGHMKEFWSDPQMTESEDVLLERP